MSVRSLILEQIVQVAEQQNRRLAPLDDTLLLMNSGLDSLCVAILVARLDDAIGLDPISDSDAAYPATLGDFIHLYERAAA